MPASWRSAVERVARAQPCRSLVEVESQAVEEGHGLRAAAGMPWWELIPSISMARKIGRVRNGCYCMPQSGQASAQRHLFWRSSKRYSRASAMCAKRLMNSRVWAKPAFVCSVKACTSRVSSSTDCVNVSCRSLSRSIRSSTVMLAPAGRIFSANARSYRCLNYIWCVHNGFAAGFRYLLLSHQKHTERLDVLEIAGTACVRVVTAFEPD